MHYDDLDIIAPWVTVEAFSEVETLGSAILPQEARFRFEHNPPAFKDTSGEQR